jgi:hypothetical protein
VARGLCEFGYPGVTVEMIRETHEAMKRGEPQMPYGVVGEFARRELTEAFEKRGEPTAA